MDHQGTQVMVNNQLGNDDVCGPVGIERSCFPFVATGRSDPYPRGRGFCWHGMMTSAAAFTVVQDEKLLMDDCPISYNLPTVPLCQSNVIQRKQLPPTGKSYQGLWKVDFMHCSYTSRLSGSMLAPYPDKDAKYTDAYTVPHRQRNFPAANMSVHKCTFVSMDSAKL